MKIEIARQLLDDFLCSLVSKVGFAHLKRLIYSRPANEATAFLSFACRVDPRGFVAFSLGIALRFESLARWLDDPGDTRPTFGTPIHFLREDKKFTEWTFSNPDDLEKLRGVIVSDVTSLALPFIERYSRLSDFRAMLESPTQSDWIELGLDVDRRVNVLAAIHLVLGDKPGAMTILNDALIERKTAPPKRRFEIEWLRNRLLEAGLEQRGDEASES